MTRWLEGTVWVGYSFRVAVNENALADPMEQAERMYANGDLLDVLEDHEIEEATYVED